MLFDLNLVCGGGDESMACDEDKTMMVVMKEEKLLDGSGTQMMDDSGTSISSIVNAAEEASNNAGIGGDENSNSNNNNKSNNTSSAFTLDILKTEGKRDTSPETVTITKDLLNGGGGDDKGGRGIVWEFSSGSSLISAMKPQWLNLSLADSSGGGFDLRVMQQQQKLRKSRRGPRSRSSQYRGVTFYRRTGRWESHIWWVYFNFFDVY